MQDMVNDIIDRIEAKVEKLKQLLFEKDKLIAILEEQRRAAEALALEQENKIVKMKAIFAEALDIKDKEITALKRSLDALGFGKAPFTKDFDHD